jgi:DNA-binding LacI/PurR family transcriptional regulator
MALPSAAGPGLVPATGGPYPEGVKRRPNIMDVAHLAGVSRATVSRVLNGGHGVIDAKVARVLEAVGELGFSVNQTARHLRKGRTGSVAFVISERHEQLFEDPNFGIRVKTFTQELEKRGLHLLVSIAQDHQEEAFLGNYLTAGHVDGVLLAMVNDGDPLLAGLLQAGVPLVVLGRPPDRLEKAVPWAAMDDDGAAYEATRFLLAEGRRRIGTIAGPLDGTSGQDRLQGYRRALGHAYRKSLVVEGDWSLESGRRGAEVLMGLHGDLDGLFVASDLMAAGAIKALKRAGRRVPRDVAVVGVDDSAAALTTEPSLTTMRNPFEETAEAAVSLLHDRMLGRSSDPEQVVIPSQLVRRGSA